MRRSYRWLPSLILLPLLGACDPGESPGDSGESPRDATVSTDAGGAIDTGTQLDAGGPFDAVGHADATLDIDTGTQLDAGGPLDAVGHADATPTTDAAGALDAEWHADATPAVDAGRRRDAGSAFDAGPRSDAGQEGDAGQPGGCDGGVCRVASCGFGAGLPPKEKLEFRATGVEALIVRYPAGPGTGISTRYELRAFALAREGRLYCLTTGLSYENSLHNWFDIARAQGPDGISYELYISFQPVGPDPTGEWAWTYTLKGKRAGVDAFAPIPLRLVSGEP